MKIAITADNNLGLDSQVAQHFGHAAYFIFADVENGKVVGTKSIANPFAEAHQPGQIPNFVHEQKANVILSGGMGGRAIEFFNQLGISAACGAAGTVNQALENYLGGRLNVAAACVESVEHGHG